ncbi:MAG TPA: hypothetical protein VK550_01850 [Polyangiaceae bacterium]|nr:hypothetical protein [Polyangiaceae bacterium]
MIHESDEQSILRTSMMAGSSIALIRDFEQSSIYRLTLSPSDGVDRASDPTRDGLLSELADQIAISTKGELV